MQPANSQKLQYFDVTATLPKGNIIQFGTGVQVTYCLIDDGSMYSWGDNMQAAIGNGKEGVFANFFAPWPGASITIPNSGAQALPVLTPFKMNPAGVSVVKFWVDNSLAMYYYFEDANGNLWNGGRNKDFVLWNGKGGDSNTMGAQPNLWDVLSPEQIIGFGPMTVVPPVTPPPVITPKTVTAISIMIDGVLTPISLTGAKITFSDGTTQ
jgi:hypothetical protein